jgi:hypothetical protein
MKNTETAVKKEQPVSNTAENKKMVENHKKAATHFTAAAKSHLAAAEHHEDGNHDKAAKCTVEAHGHSCVAHDAQRENSKHHASKV